MTPPLDNTETFVTVLALAVGIALPRFLPFLLFSEKRKLPAGIRYLGAVLPHASMAMLLIYCLKHVAPAQPPHGLPEALGLIFTVLVHLWRGNVLLSIAGGTVFYMLLVQRVF